MSGEREWRLARGLGNPTTTPPSGCPSRVVGRGNDGLYFLRWAGGIELVGTLRSIAANGCKDPEVIDAAPCTFLHEGRIACVIGQPFAFRPSSQ
jgi:hypothetical protein